LLLLLLLDGLPALSRPFSENELSPAIENILQRVSLVNSEIGRLGRVLC